MRTYLLGAVLAVCVLSLAAASSRADIAISTYGASPFLYGGYSYVPLRDTCDYIGASLSWDSHSREALISYRSRELTLIAGSSRGYYLGNAVDFPGPLILAHNQLYAPSAVFGSYLGVPVRWESSRRRVFFLGSGGWGYYEVLPYAPTYIVSAFPGYGYPGDYPFLYSGTTYIPARSSLDWLGVVLIFDSYDDSCSFYYGGQRVSFVIGSPYVFIGHRRVRLSHPPIYVRNRVYIPQALFVDHL